jgi:hypothetical protein
MNFRKPEGQGLAKPTLTHDSVQTIILNESERIIAERGGRASTDEILRGVIISLLMNGISNFSEYPIIETLKRRFEQRQSYWSFKPTHAHLIGKYEQLKDVIQRIIDKCLEQDIIEQKTVVAEVLTALPNGRTPDLRMVLGLINENMGNRKGRGNATRLELLPT